jgi:ABC-type Na+ efflux pump permease subunit
MSTPHITALPEPDHAFFSLNRVGAIARNTFDDLVRQKVFHFVVAFALVLIGFSLFQSGISFQHQANTLRGACFGAMTIFSSLLAVLATAQVLPRDLEDRTLYTILSKPVSRFEYLVGKLSGIIGILALALLLMSLAFGLVLYFFYAREAAGIFQGLAAGPDRDAALKALAADTANASVVGGVCVIFIRAVVCAALTLMVSTFATSSLFTVMVAVGMIVIGFLVPIARDYWVQQTGGTAALGPRERVFLGLVTVVCPDMQLFNIVDDIAAGAVMPLDIFLSTMGFGVGYLLVYLFVAYLFFAWKEL